MPTEINNNTYQLNYSTDEINNAIIYIRKIFKTGYMVPIENSDKNMNVKIISNFLFINILLQLRGFVLKKIVQMKEVQGK